MKLVSFYYEGNSRIGNVSGDKVIDLNNAYRAMLESQGELRAKQIAEAYVPANMTEFLQGGAESLARAKAASDYALSAGESSYKLVHQLSEVKLAAPVLNPGKIVCVGQNYREHILEMKRELPKIPVVFAKFSNTLIGPNDDIPLYPVSDTMDYEAELAVVIGKRARNVKQADALNYVAGYTVANDVTYRELQRRTIEWLQGKTVEGTLPMGPWLVTSDEIPDPAGMDIKLTLNGQEMQHSNTANLVFTVPFLIEFLSELMTLEPGDIILTGTPGGVGFARDPQVFMKDGDVVRVEIDKIGALENRVKKV
jgi:acylpyruvate hydrolase